MRVIAVLASLAVAVAAATLPSSLVTLPNEPTAQMADGAGDRDHDGLPDTQSEPEEDDDLDERIDDVDDLLAVIDPPAERFVLLVNEASWLVHDVRSPRAPHPEDTLRPPIAG